MTDNKTETEQIYEEMTGKADEEQTQAEQAEETEEQEDVQDEIMTEEELEIEREIEAYQTKIDELSVKLTEYKLKKINDIKRSAMKEAHYSDEQIELYAKFIDGETADEIKQNVLNLTMEIPPKNDNFADPSLMNGAKAKVKTTDFAEIGRQAFGRVKNKIFPHLR